MDASRNDDGGKSPFPRLSQLEATGREQRRAVLSLCTATDFAAIHTCRGLPIRIKMARRQSKDMAGSSLGWSTPSGTETASSPRSACPSPS